MNKPLYLYVVLVLGTFGWWHPVWGYEILTHEKMSHETAMGSMLGKPDGKALADLGLKFSITDDRQQFPNSSGEQKNIRNLIGDGANFEDDFPRSANHFFDPLRSQPLPGGRTSPDWALEDRGVVTGQEYSYRDAQDYLYKALTLPTRTERDKNFGLTFQTLGQIIHHLQDMAQPQHVRNDTHCDRWYCPGPAHDPSLYEKYTDLPGVRNSLPFTGYGPVGFNSPRAFWTTTDGQGIADFTNRNFLSKDTNFNYLDPGQVTRNSRYPLPVWDGTTEPVSIRTLLAQDGTCPPGTPISQPPCNLEGEVVFHGATVYDYATNSGAIPNPRASTLSLFDQDLKTYNVKITYTDPDDPFSVTYEYDRLFTLNRFNFQAAYPHLIPKAVGYSAGLIDYFFRGKLEITLPDEAVYGIVDHSQINQKDTQGFTRIKMKLKNATPDIVAGGAKFPQDMTGGKLELVAKFRRNTCYQPDLTGEFSQQSQRTWNGQCGTNDFRSPEEIAVSQPIGSVTLPADPKAAPTLFTFEFDPAKPIPINATDLYLQVVYRGPLGAEADAVAVATNDVYEPTYFTFLNNTDYFPANGKFYKVYNDPYNPQNPYTPELLAQVDRDNNGIPDVPVDPVTSTLMRLRVDASTKDVAVAASLPPARQWRVTYLTDQSPHTIRVLASGVTAAPLQVSAETVQNDALGRLAISPPSRMTRGFIRFNLIYIYRDPYGALPPLDDVDTLGPLKDLTLVPVGVVFNPGP